MDQTSNLDEALIYFVGKSQKQSKKSTIVEKIKSFFKKDENLELIDNLENKGMIDLMHHQHQRFFNVHSIWINHFALWQKWIRS